MISYRKKRFVTISEITAIKNIGLDSVRIRHFCQAHYRGAKIKDVGLYNANAYDKWAILDEMEQYFSKRHDLITIAEIEKTTRWKFETPIKLNIAELLKSKHMTGIVYRLGRMLKYYFNQVDFWVAMESHRKEALQNMQDSAKQSRLKRDKSKFREMGEYHIFSEEKVKGSSFSRQDLWFFKSWNNRRPEKYKVDLNTFSILGLKLKKNGFGRYVTIVGKKDLSDIWYASQECKNLQADFGDSNVEHFLNVLGY